MFSFNSDLRAVEFFIRDKYEKKKYYSKNVTNGSSVCIGFKSVFTVLQSTADESGISCSVV